jgi:hypothetical protein
LDAAHNTVAANNTVVVKHGEPVSGLFCSPPSRWRVLGSLHSGKFVDVYGGNQRLALHDTMNLKHPERSIRGRFPIRGLAIVAILLFGLLGGLFHHHVFA